MQPSSWVTSKAAEGNITKPGEQSYIAARNIFAQIGARNALVHLIGVLGEVYHLQGDPLKAEESYVAARDICARLGDQNALAKTAMGLGIVYH